MKLSIVIPCYNEADNLVGLFERLHVAFGKANFPLEFVLVNNGSQDKSQDIFARLLADSQNDFVKLIEIKKNQGYGYGILAGLNSSKGEFIGWTHADLQTDPLDAVVGYQKLINSPFPEHSLLRGKRMGRHPLDVFFTWGMGLVSSVVLRSSLKDINAQPKIFHRSLLEKMINPPFDFSLDLYLFWIAKKENLQIIEFPVTFSRRRFGEAKGGGTLRGKIKLVKRTWKYIFELRKRLEK